MLKISANTDNIVWVNASRNKTLSNPTYLMSLEHRVSGEKKYFIPQNITSFSGRTTYQEEPRADLFRFGVNNGIENLTGGTKGWLWKVSPNYEYDDVRLKGTGKSYFKQNLWLVSNINIGIVQFDWEDTNDRMDDVNDTGFTITINDIPITSNLQVLRLTRGGGTDECRFLISSITYPYPFEDIYKINYTGTTTGGTSMTGEVYIPNYIEVNAAQPWTYYGDDSPINYKSYPTTYLGETNITLENYGWYYYRIYEQTSQINLNPSLATNVVDEGSLYLYPPPPDEVNYTGYSNNDITIYE